MNEIIVNPEKILPILLDKRKSDLTNLQININDKAIKSVSSVKLLGITMDDKLNINLHIGNICRSVVNQQNALIRLKPFLNFKVKQVLINSYILLNINYYPLVWMFGSVKSANKIESLQKRTLQFLLDDNTLYYKHLLENTGMVKISISFLLLLLLSLLFLLPLLSSLIYFSLVYNM